MHHRRLASILSFLLLSVLLSGCMSTLSWPQESWHAPVEDFTGKAYPETRQEALEAIVGRYAHYDVVAYQDDTTKTPMLSFIISYGFTDLFVEDGRLYQKDTFLYANQKINQRWVTSRMSDAAVQAIKPRVQEVMLTREDGIWHLYRPPSPTLLGIKGDPSKVLTDDPNDPAITDPDGDGNPGITVEIAMRPFFAGELYIIRREIYENFLELQPDLSFYGHVVDSSEQLVLGASKKILEQPSGSIQVAEPYLNPLILIPISRDIDSAEALRAIAQDIFPPEPQFDP